MFLRGRLVKGDEGRCGQRGRAIGTPDKSLQTPVAKSTLKGRKELKRTRRSPGGNTESRKTAKVVIKKLNTSAKNGGGKPPSAAYIPLEDPRKVS